MIKAWEMKPERTYIETTSKYNKGILFRISNKRILQSDDDCESWYKSRISDEEILSWEFKENEYMTVRRLVDEMADRAFEENRLDSILESFPKFFTEGIKREKDTVKKMYKNFLLPNIIESLGEENQIVEDEMGRTYVLMNMNNATDEVTMMCMYDDSEIIVSFEDMLDMKITHQAVKKDDK